MEIHMGMIWETKAGGLLTCDLGSHDASVRQVGGVDDSYYRVFLHDRRGALGSMTFPNQRIACQVGEKALSLLAELDEKDAPTIDEVVEDAPTDMNPLLSEESTSEKTSSSRRDEGNGASTEPSGMLGQGDPV